MNDGAEIRTLFSVAVVRVRIVGWADIFHFQDVAAFWAALDGAVA